ncbi:transcriptional regulator, LacI family [Wenyingzhuangia marina]|uniref:Transcriptional regulator, LacI family n=2 Tax=Wenyingzhuangia marina TaxID=1195760 RepID=A0A1M5WFB2_9FLAO|nr:transcriptional regulator, LacI family [Wenyingzhuangia marina]
MFFYYIYHMRKKYTIKDIAELAGVSKGTVDRVIHKRGKVSEKALIDVTRILEEIDYKPNLIARNLKNNKVYSICVLIPDYHLDDYWLSCKEGIESVKQEFASFDIQIKTLLYHSKDVNSFLQKSNEVLALKPDAVLMVPSFQKESETIINLLANQDIVVSIFNNNIPNNKIFNFVGQDLIKSGRIAAKLFDLILGNGKVAILYIGANFKNATYFHEKDQGFKEYIKQTDTALSSVTQTFSSENLELELTNFLSQNPDVKGIFVTNSKTYMVAKLIKKHNLKDIKLIGYDLLEENITYLKNNTIQFLIHQNAKHQIHLGLTNLIEYFMFSKKTPKRNLLPINIINSENLSSYTQKETIYE